MVSTSAPSEMKFWLICLTCWCVSTSWFCFPFSLSSFFFRRAARIAFFPRMTMTRSAALVSPRHVMRETASWAVIAEISNVSIPLLLSVFVLLLLMSSDGFCSNNLGKAYFRYDEVPSDRFVTQLASRGYLSQQLTNLWDGNYETSQASHKGGIQPNIKLSYAGDTPAEELTRAAAQLVTHMKSKQELDDRSGTWGKMYTAPRWLAGGPLIDGQVLGTGFLHGYIQGRPVETPAAPRFGFTNK